MTSLSKVQDATLRARLAAVPKNARRYTDLHESDLVEADLIVHPTDLGMGFISYEEAIAQDGKLLTAMLESPDTDYIVVKPRTLNFVTFQETLRLDGVRRYIDSADHIFGLGVGSEPRLYEMEDGLLVLLDGNHRMAAAFLTGRTIEVAIRRRAVAIAA